MQRTRYAGNQFRRDEERKTISLEAHNGFEYGDLNFSLEDLDLKNRLSPANDFHNIQANLTHSQDFGELRNHRSETRASYSDRDGTFGVATLDADQTISLQHSDILSSSYGYAYSSNESAFATATSHFVNAGAEYLDAEVVVDGKLITSRMPDDLPAFCRLCSSRGFRTEAPAG